MATKQENKQENKNDSIVVAAKGESTEAIFKPTNDNKKGVIKKDDKLTIIRN